MAESPAEDFSYVCSCCGQRHDMPFAMGFDKPWHWISASDSDPTSRLTPDLCMIEHRDYFVRGVLRIPIVDGPEPSFDWGVWASLSPANFERTVELLDSPLGEREPPYFGWLCSELAPFYPSTLGLKTHVQTQAVGIRPLIELEPTDHPLAIEQRQGITFERVKEIARRVLHPATVPDSPEERLDRGPASRH